MAAIITPTFRKQLADDLFNSFDDSDNFYIGIGRSEQWNTLDDVVVPVSSLKEEKQARESLQSIIQVPDRSYVVPKNNWQSGTIYSAYKDNLSAYPNNPYYVLTQANAVYICLYANKNSNGVTQASNIEPSGSSKNAFRTGDGYVWKFLYTLGTAESNKFLSSGYMPVKLVIADPGNTVSDLEQLGIQDSAIPGQIANFDIVNPGAGYTSDPTVTILGDGTITAKATATYAAGVITKVVISDSAGTVMMGRDYNKVEVVLTGGGSPTTTAVVRAVIAPQGGYGADPRNDLRSTAIMFNAKPAGPQGGDFLIGNDFRQIVLLRDILQYDSSEPFIETTGRAGKKLTKSSGNFLSFANDGVVVGGISGAKAIIDYVDSDQLIVHQTEITGYRTFVTGDTLTTTEGGSGIMDSEQPPEIDIYSGKLMLIDNRASISRSVDQTEDIKPIIQF